jgi:hypothetical protein
MFILGKNDVQPPFAFIASFYVVPCFPALSFSHLTNSYEPWFSWIKQFQIPFNPFETEDLERCFFWTLNDHAMIEPLVLNYFGWG